MINFLETFSKSLSNYIQKAKSKRGYKCPVHDPYKIVVEFGFMYFGTQKHLGIDLEAPKGTPIYAAKAGKVLGVWTAPDTGSISIVIVHDDGYETEYAHLIEMPDFQPGDFVDTNTIIGKMGDTGSPGRVHLHFGIRKWVEERKDFDFFNPKRFIKF